MDIELEDYIIEKGDKTDIISSLKKLNKRVLKEILSMYKLNTVQDLAKYKLKSVKDTFDMLPGEPSSIVFYTKLLNYEDSGTFVPVEIDLLDFVAFAYKRGNILSYYIPDEMKVIIKEYLKTGK